MLNRATALFLLLAQFSFTANLEPVMKKETIAVPAPPVRLTKDGEKWAAKTLKKMSMEEKIGQLIMVRALAEFQNSESPAYLELRDQIRKYHIGSVVMTVRVDGPFLMRNQPYEAAMTTNRLQTISDLPLLIAADFERGLSMRINATPQFPHAMAFGATRKPEYEEAFARIVARESRAIGVHWNFFPVTDVNSNPLNPIINTRSFGEDPQAVGDFVTAYIRGSREGGMLSTAKHFPGHGDTDTDSHLAVGRVGGDMARLWSVELPPFQRAIDAGVDSIMAAHVTVPAVEPDTNKVASISSRVINGLLISEMKFTGLVVTDALDMRGLTNAYRHLSPAAAAGRAAVDAILAGNDMCLMPSDLEGTYEGLLAAARSGEISMEALDARALRILQAKASLGLNKERFVDIDAVSQLVGRPADMALAQEIADAAVTLVKDNHQALGLFAAERAAHPGTSTVRATYELEAETVNHVLGIVLTDDVRSEMGRSFEREFSARVPETNMMFVDSRNAGALTDAAVKAARSSREVVIAAFAAPSAGRRAAGKDQEKGSVGLAGDSGVLLEKVLKVASDKTVMIALGNPYLASDFPEVQTYLCTFSSVPSSEVAAVKALFGEMPIRGRLPVSIPNVAQRGSGIDRNTLNSRMVRPNHFPQSREAQPIRATR